MLPGEFHRLCRQRCERFPDAMLATATHDHKRGEDVRARLAVLSEMPDEWGATLRRWMAMNAACKGSSDGMPAPSPGDEIMLYQTLLGAWPTTLAVDDSSGLEAFTRRIAGWQQKALREAKLRTSWASPNAAYELAAREFLGSIMRGGFVTEVAQLVDRIGPAGAVNGLAQVLLKLTVPGVPDIYQGTEFWDDTLVDPDNRRPVDFAMRARSLESAHPPTELAAHWRDGRVKQAVITRALAVRRRQPALFARGNYTALAVDGARAANVISFARQAGSDVAIVIVPRLPLVLLPPGGGILIPPEAWLDTTIRLPAGAEGRFADAISGRSATGGDVRLADVLVGFPAALLVSDGR